MRRPSRRARPSRACDDLLSRGAGRACPGCSGPARCLPARSPHLSSARVLGTLRADHGAVSQASSVADWLTRRLGAEPGAGIPDRTLKLFSSGSLSSASHLTAALTGYSSRVATRALQSRLRHDAFQRLLSGRA